MAFFKCAFLFVAIFAMVSSMPAPGGWWGPKHEHYVIHVPYKVHTVHHHHVHKVGVPIYKERTIIKEVPIVKEVPIYKDLHHHHHSEPIISHHESHGWL